MKNKLWYYLEGAMLLLWIVTLVIFLIVVTKEGTKCLSNPLIFGTKYLSEKNNASFTCKCSFDNSPDIVYSIDKKHWEVSNTENIPISLNFTGG